MKTTRKTLLIALFFVFSSLSPSAEASDAIEISGDILQIAIPATGYAATFYLDDSQGRIQFYKSYAMTLGVTFALKYALNERRPNGGEYSFPSGHTSSAFAGAAFIHRRYGFAYAALAYLCAAFVGYSRVESDNHYTRDVIAGAAIGMASGFYFTDRYKGFTIKPEASDGTYKIFFSRNF